MITRLQIKNFKSWADTGRLDLAPLSGFFGTNSSGKTSILQMLLLLKQTVESLDRWRVLNTGDERALADLGTFYDLLHNHKMDEILEFNLTWHPPKPLKIENPEEMAALLFETNILNFQSIIKEKSGRPVVERFLYYFNDLKFGMQSKSTTKPGYDMIHEGYDARRVKGRPWPLPAPVKCYGFPIEATGYYQNLGFLPAIVFEFEALFSGTFYLGPLRDYPKRGYTWAGEDPGNVGRKGELAIPALLAAGKRTALSLGKGVKKPTIEERIAYWLREMGMIHDFKLEPIAKNRKDYELRVRTKPGSPWVLITDVGFGVSQILPVLTLCYYVPENSIILLEQPEIHLHPSVQAGLADVFIEVATKRNVQIILESHSEHLLRRLQRRIAEVQIQNSEAALFFCRMENSASRIEKLQVDLYGNIANWPENFFGDEMGDLNAMTQAAMRRDRGNG